MLVFDKTLSALTDSGNAPLSLDLENTVYRHCPEAKEPAYSQLKKVGSLWQTFSVNLKSVIHQPETADKKIVWIMKNNVPLPAEMNKAVGMMQKQSESKLKLLFLIQIIGILIGIIFGSFAFLVIVAVARKLNETIDSLNASATEVTQGSSAISNSSQSLAEGATQQAASLEESSTSIEQMSSQTDQNAEHAKQANAMMKKANQDVSNTNESMTAINSSMDQISKSSEETSKIIRTIDEIAFQTNLLALNAAVEAARAGEAGAGFAVVADEVRSLAMRAASAAKNTAELIQGTVAKIDAGAEVVKKTKAAFVAVTEDSRKVGRLLEDISLASSEQAQGISHINQAVREMDIVVQNTAAISEESAAASEQMNAQAKEMHSIVSSLGAMVHGTNGANHH